MVVSLHIQFKLFFFYDANNDFIMLPRAQVSTKRINEVLDTKPSIIDGNKQLTDLKHLM